MRALHPTGSLQPGRALLGVVAASLLLSGCAGAPGDSSPAVTGARIVDGYDCLAPNLSGWVHPPGSTGTDDPGHPDAPEAGRVPAGFAPTTAVRCDLLASIDDAEGRWSGVSAVTLTGDLTRLLAALAEPDDDTWLGPCTADMELVSPLWLVDSTGRAINAHYPRTGCGKTKSGVRGALAQLTVRETTALRRTLMEPRAALDSGCPAEWTTLPEGSGRSYPFTGSFTGSFSGTDEIPPATSTPRPMAVPDQLDGMRWCRYAVKPVGLGAPESSGPTEVPGTITLRTGRFVAGGTLDPATAREVAVVAASEPVPPSCEAPPTMFLVLWPSQGAAELGGAYTVELDGCGLFHRDGSGSRPLPSDLRELLAAQTSPGE